MKKTVLMCAALGVAATASRADARSFRQSQIPNSPGQCLTCHEMFAGGPRNAFGQDVENALGEPASSADVDWSSIFNLDSDGDGFTNGEELGDPNGTWTIGTMPPSGPVYDPSDAASLPTCGNDVIDTPAEEDCDGSDLNGETCASLNLGDGDLSCSATCTFDSSACSAGVPDAGPSPDSGGGAGGGSEPEDDGGCRSVGPSTLTVWALLAAFPLLARRRRIPLPVAARRRP